MQFIFGLENLSTFSLGLFVFLNLIRHVAGLIWTSDQLFAKAFYRHRSTQHINTKTNIHAPSAIRTRDPSNQASKTYALDRAATGIGQNTDLMFVKEAGNTQPQRVKYLFRAPW
jgi:hypothetical protein